MPPRRRVSKLSSAGLALVHESVKDEAQIQAAVLAGCFTMSFMAVMKHVAPRL